MRPRAPSPKVKVVMCCQVAVSSPLGGTLLAVQRSDAVVAGAITGPVQLPKAAVLRLVL